MVISVVIVISWTELPNEIISKYSGNECKLNCYLFEIKIYSLYIFVILIKMSCDKVQQNHVHCYSCKRRFMYMR